jgi:branched-chain amino acid transport system permease protein
LNGIQEVGGSIPPSSTISAIRTRSVRIAQPQALGRGRLSSQLERVVFGLLIVGFLIFEPLGLYGIWIRVRNYWKAWPFSY